MRGLCVPTGVGRIAGMGALMIPGVSPKDGRLDKLFLRQTGLRVKQKGDVVKNHSEEVPTHVGRGQLYKERLVVARGQEKESVS